MFNVFKMAASALLNTDQKYLMHLRIPTTILFAFNKENLIYKEPQYDFYFKLHNTHLKGEPGQNAIDKTS